MDLKIIWSPDAGNDLEAIFNYISRDSVTIAAKVAERILAAIDRLGLFPHSGPKIREWRNLPNRHSAVPPYRIIYRVDDGTVVIIAIVHGAQDLKKLMRIPRRR